MIVKGDHKREKILKELTDQLHELEKAPHDPKVPGEIAEITVKINEVL